jgi:hypothetical protein
MLRRGLGPFLGLLAGAATAAAQTPPAGALIWLEVTPPPAAYRVAEAAPPRFALLPDGRVFTGGTSAVLAGKLAGDEVKALERELEALRKLPGLGGGSIALGGVGPRWRLRSLKGKQAFELEATGDPAQAAGGARPLAAFLSRLDGYHHPTLRPFSPNAFGVVAREEALPGGCRRWTLPVSPAEALGGHRLVPAEAVESWPKGSAPASVCAAGKAYVVGLKPLLPDEQP